MSKEQEFKISISISDLERMLKEQRRIMIERCMSNSSFYNKEGTESHSFSLKIDKDKFLENGEKAAYPQEFLTLKKYLL